MLNNLEKLGFDNWFWESIPSGEDKVDLSKTSDLNIVRVISVNKNSFVVSNSISWTSRLPHLHRSYCEVSGMIGSSVQNQSQKMKLWRKC